MAATSLPMDDQASGQSALRRGRASLPQHAYHLTFTTAERHPLFRDFWTGSLVAQCLYHGELLRDTQTLVWVLMPDHLHWLVQLGNELSLDQLVRRFKSASAQRVNRHRGVEGELWQKGYYDHLVRDDENLQNVARYIVANPLRAGLVKWLGDYPWWNAVWLDIGRG